MRKFKFVLTVLFLSLIVTESFSQISLPKGFRCIISDIHQRENYFSDGTYRFHSEAWGREVQEPSEMKELMENNYEHKIVFNKTKDNLYWGTGLYNGEYKYIVIIPDALTTVVLSSSRKGTQFSNYSAWLLQQIRNNHSGDKEYYLTNYKGKSCE